MKTIRLIPCLIATFAWLNSCTKDANETQSQKDTTIVIKDTVHAHTNILELKSGNTIIKIDPNVGARITSFSVEESEVLIQKEESEIYGSTFWTAPQSAWGWPPIEAIDNLSYSKVDENSFQSGTADTLGVTITKQFISNPDSSFSITYTIKNNTDSTIKIAPWEITRVASGGNTIFPTEKAVFRGKKPFGELKITSKDGISIMRYDSSAINDNKKSFAYASKGWLAQHKNNLLLIKQFENIKPSQCAPDESEIEIYANPNKVYIEIEQQGMYKPLESGSKYSWTVKWYLRKVQNKNYTEKEYQKIIESIIN